MEEIIFPAKSPHQCIQMLFINQLWKRDGESEGSQLLCSNRTQVMAKQQRQLLNERRDDDKHAHANATANKSRKRLKKVSMAYKQRWFPTVPKAISVWASALSSHRAHYVWRGLFDPIGVWDDETLKAADLCVCVHVCVCAHTIVCICGDVSWWG